MDTVLLAPETFNLAETTRAIEVARRLRDRHECVFAGYSERYAGLIEEAGFEYHALTPPLSEEQDDQAIRFDQGSGIDHPFTLEMLRERVESERALNALLGPAATVIGSTLSQFVSARADDVPLVYVKPFAYSWPHLRRSPSLPVLQGNGHLARAVNTTAARLLRETPGPPPSNPGDGSGSPRRTVCACPDAPSTRWTATSTSSPPSGCAPTCRWWPA